MKISIPVFRGRAPRVSPRALSEGYAQVALSPRLLSGDLESWKERSAVLALPKGSTSIADIAGVHRLASRSGDTTPYWLHWTQSELVAGESRPDVVLGPIPSDPNVTTFISGLAAGPRYTTKFLATDESQRGAAAVGAYPYKTLPLGIAAPTDPLSIVQTIPPIVPGSESFMFDGSDISGWVIGEGSNTEFNDGLTQRNWSVDNGAGTAPGANGSGNPAPAFVGICARSARILMQRDFRLDESAAFNFKLDFKFQTSNTSGTSGFRLRYLSTDGSGPAIFFQFGGSGINTVTFIEGTGSQQVYPLTMALSTFFTVQVEGALRDDGYFGVTVTVKNGSTTLLTITGRAQGIGGSIGLEVTSDGGQTPRVAHVDNLTGTIISQPPSQPVPVFTNYVYTLVNSAGQESAPSPPSRSVTVDNGITNTLTIPAQSVADIAKVYIYRASSSLEAAQYLFVDEVAPPYPEDYDDTKDSTEIGPDALITTDFDLPPSDLRGLITLPGGALAGFSGNQLCFSEPEYSYAWPVKYRLTTDFNIVAIASIDSVVAVFTESFVYFASGNRPGDYAMGKPETPQGCVSKRSVAGISSVGILYATPDGLYAVTGSGPPRNTTELIFSRKEWQALKPSSIIGAAHDDRYFGFYDATSIGGSKGSFVLDFREGGFGLIDMPDHATATYVDPITDTLYFTADDVLAVPARTANTLLSWDTAAALRAYRWRSRLYLLPVPAAFMAAQVRAADYTSLTLRIYGDGVLMREIAVTSEREFVLLNDEIRRLEIEIAGTSRVFDVQIAESMDELE